MSYTGASHPRDVLRNIPIETIRTKAMCQAQSAVDKKVLELHKHGITILDAHRKATYDMEFEKAFYEMGGTLRALGC